MGGDARADVSAEAARRIRDAARTHKRLANQHRRQAQTLMAEFARLRERLARAGIHIDD